MHFLSPPLFPDAKARPRTCVAVACIAPTHHDVCHAVWTMLSCTSPAVPGLDPHPMRFPRLPFPAIRPGGEEDSRGFVPARQRETASETSCEDEQGEWECLREREKLREGEGECVCEREDE